MTRKTDARKFARMMDQAVGEPCLLCPRPSVRVAFWIPTESASRRLGAPIGKLRISAVPLCKLHAARPDSMSRAEEVLFAHAAREMAEGTMCN